MQCRVFGRTGMSVSCIGFGAGHIGSAAMEETAVATLLGEVLDLGVTLIDTARGYGLSEERIGRHLAHRRRDFILSTKIGYGVEGVPDWSPAIIPAGVAQALRLLRTDYLDIVHLHSCPTAILQNSELLETLTREKKAGRIRAIAYSGENEDLAFAIKTGVFDSLQFSVNIADQRSIYLHLPEAANKGMGVIAKRPLANVAWRFAERPHGNYAETYWERLQAMALDPGTLGWHELALRFVLSVPGVQTCIIGTGNIEHFRKNIELASHGALPEIEYKRVRSSFDRHDQNWVGQV